MFKLIGLGMNNDLNLINKYIEESDEIYLTESLFSLYEDNKKVKKLNEKVNLDEIKDNRDKNIYFITLGNILIDSKFGRKILNSIKKNHIDYEIIKAESILNLAYENIQCEEELNLIEYSKQLCLDKGKNNFIYGFLKVEESKSLLEKIKKQYSEADLLIFEITNNKEFIIIEKINNYFSSKNIRKRISLGIYIKKTKRNFEDLMGIVERLRAPEGCPWDREQSHKTLKRELVEECYEVLDAIDKEDKEALREEIGDVLLHVAFHGTIAKESGEFDILDVTDGICEKMIFRHPHIFGKEIVNNSKDVLANWDDIKKKEKGYKTLTDEINGIAKGLPALVRASKVQKKAAKVGFDFENFEEGTKALEGEIIEFKEVYKSDDKARIKDELGDVFFSAVNVGRLLGFDCEEVLEEATEKFIKRFSKIEYKALEKGHNLKDMTMKEMDLLWETVKKEKK